MLDEMVRRELAAVAADIHPQPDPFTRLQTRARRQRTQRVAVVGLLMVISLVAGGLVFGHLDAGAAPTQPPLTRAAWLKALIDSPTRGAVGQSATFVAALSAALLGKKSQIATLAAEPDVSVRVLFADDVAQTRVALAVFLPEPNTQTPTAVWLYAPVDAKVQALADSLGTTGSVSAGLDPFAVKEIPTDTGMAAVGIAPDDCVVDSASLPAVDGWRPEPTTSYVIRTPQQRGAEWWRVICDGVVRYQIRAPFASQLVADIDSWG